MLCASCIMVHKVKTVDSRTQVLGQKFMFIHVTMTSFAITVCGQCFRRHVLGHRVVSDISVVKLVVEVFYSLCSESNKVMLLLTTPAHCCTWNVYFASHTKHSLTYRLYNMAACT